MVDALLIHSLNFSVNRDPVSAYVHIFNVQAGVSLEPKMARNSGNRTTIIPILRSEEELHGTDHDVLQFKGKVYG